MADPDPNNNTTNANATVVAIQSMVEEAEPYLPADCCIYRVPHELRKSNKEAYTPTAVSIGPLHHGDPGLQKMEGHKQVYCRKFIQRCRTSLDDLVRYVQLKEPKVRRSYSEEIKLSKEELVKVIFIDSCFIFEFLLMQSESDGDDDDAVWSTPWLLRDIICDLLLLLENQLPFFIVDELYNLALGDDNVHGPPFIQLIASVWYSADAFDYNGSIARKPEHFTDMLRSLYLLPYSPPLIEHGMFSSIHVFEFSATELNEAGVKFSESQRGKLNLDLDLSSGHCILGLPQIFFEVGHLVLRNIVALEQCHYPNQPYLSHYVALLDSLIKTDKDVDVLVRSGIIRSDRPFDSNVVAAMLKGTAQNILLLGVNPNYLDIAKKLNDYCRNSIRVRMSILRKQLRRDYCNTPWKTAATIAAIALLIFTFVQTLCSIFQVKWKDLDFLK